MGESRLSQINGAYDENGELLESQIITPMTISYQSMIIGNSKEVLDEKSDSNREFSSFFQFLHNFIKIPIILNNFCIFY